ncbi:MAG TPA: YfdX family protein [Thermopetrobacter sp.]|nr:YfdX family protein [Thermopetrobacter sp.]
MRLSHLPTISLAALLLAMPMMSPPATAKDAPAATTAKTLNKARQQARETARAKGAKRAREERTKIFREAVQALLETRKAIAALDKKDKNAALAALEKVIGKLEIILARDPKLALAPVDIITYATDIHADVASVRKAIAKSVELLNGGRVQDARAIVSQLASELVIEITNIPLATYPDAIKAVVPLVEKEEHDKAKEALIAALNTLVISRHIVPLPVLRAEALLAQAETLAQKKERGEKAQKQLDGLLKAARQELQFAEALGYGKRDDFKGFYRQIDAIERKVAGGKYGTGFFDELKKALADFRKKLF